jgi:hypothetical protein
VSAWTGGRGASCQRAGRRAGSGPGMAAGPPGLFRGRGAGLLQAAEVRKVQPKCSARAQLGGPRAGYGHMVPRRACPGLACPGLCRRCAPLLVLSLTRPSCRRTQLKVDHDPEDYVTKQVFITSRDGTKVRKKPLCRLPSACQAWCRQLGMLGSGFPPFPARRVLPRCSQPPPPSLPPLLPLGCSDCSTALLAPPLLPWPPLGCLPPHPGPAVPPNRPFHPCRCPCSSRTAGACS